MTHDGRESDADSGPGSQPASGPVSEPGSDPAREHGAGQGSEPGAEPGAEHGSGQPWWGQPWGGQAPTGGATGGASGGAPYPGQLDAHPGGPDGRGPGSGGPDTPSTRGSHRHVGVGGILLVAIVALLAGGGGAALGVGFGRNHVTVKQAAAVSPSVVGAASSSSQTALEAVAAAAAPTVVLVTERTSSEIGTGSGIVIDAASGYVLTNNHVVSGYATDGGTLTVTTSGGTTVPATVVGRDPTADIAVIKVTLAGLTQARIGDSTELRVGQTVVAFGSPLGLQGTVTSGIVSALDRPVSTQDSASGDASATQATIDAIQTDAAINPGNSGGPLVDLSGDVIGVNSAIASVSGASGDGQSTEAGNIGVGFAIPIDEAMYTADQLIKTGHAVHAVIGVSLQADNDASSTAGATVSAVLGGGPAAKAGIQPGDVLVAVDGKAIPDADSAIVAIRADHKPGDVVHVTIQRGGQQRTVSVTLGASAPS